jgi:L-lysine exporter family protein LysE/ArgO
LPTLLLGDTQVTALVAGFSLSLAIAASLTFFFSLGYGARLLTPVFHQPRAWKLLDGLITLIMYTIAASLLWRVLA